MRALLITISTVALTLFGISGAFAQDSAGYECDNAFGACGTPEQSGGGGGCGCGGGSILVANTDLGDTYQYADDFDDDGIEDNFDNCPRVSNVVQGDGDGDGHGDACDNCLNTANPGLPDLDGDGTGDGCDTDIDGDGIDNSGDNCELVPNPIPAGLSIQPDLDGNGFGDACDDDIDGDGEPNLEDACPMNAAILQPTQDQLASCFPDLDGDSVDDIRDLCPTLFNPGQEDMDDNGLGDACDPDIDGDGIQNVHDNCPTFVNIEQLDLDRDGIGESCDPQFCYVVLGDQQNCLDPEAPLTLYSPPLAAKTGDPILLRLFANRKSQAMRYSWRVVSSPDVADMRIDNATGTVTFSSPYEYHYLQDSIASFVGTHPGEYTVEVTVETIWEDRVSGLVGETSKYLTKVSVEGDPADLPEAEGDDMAGGCSVATSGGEAAGFGLLLLLGLVGLRRRR